MRKGRGIGGGEGEEEEEDNQHVCKNCYIINSHNYRRGA